MKTLERNHFPKEFVKYFKIHYTNQEACVVTKSFKTETFKFARGVTQGNPMSPLIFLLTFNPIIQFLMSNQEKGFDMGNGKIVTLPFADDCCLISRDKRTHQRLINEINSKIKSMGMRLKPSKCRAFSVSAGKSKNIPFFIGDSPIPSTEDEIQKFLGKVILFTGKQSDTLEYLSSKFKEKLDFLDAALIRDEFKMWIYKYYFLPSVRFLLTVHDLTNSSLKSLDATCDRYLKKWAGLPNGATLQVIHSKYALSVTSISDLYSLCHTLEVVNVRLTADARVNNAVDDERHRELNNRKDKTDSTTKALLVLEEAMTLASASVPVLPTAMPSVKLVKKHAKNILTKQSEVRDRLHLGGLVQQGGLLANLHDTQLDPEWGSHVFDMRKGTLKFLLNGFINTLPTMNNLKLWGISSSDRCKLCKNRNSTLHVLSGCKVALDQQRYTWRHNCVLLQIANLFKGNNNYKLTSDLPNFPDYDHSTVNLELTVTNLNPDIVLEGPKDVYLLELTVPFETNISKQHNYKMLRYGHFYMDISSKKVHILAWEVGARGILTKENKNTLKLIHALSDRKQSLSQVCRAQQQSAITSSHHIFLNRRNPGWITPSLF